MAHALDLVDGASRAAAMLKPMRLRVLDALREPGSASSVARTLGLPRQKVNYHLRELEKAGFLEEVEERRAGNCVERIVRARASHYLIHPEILGSLGATPEAVRDKFSATYLIALAWQLIRDVATAHAKAEKAKKRIATLAIETDVRFANAEDRAAFAEELANAVARLAAKYHDEEAAGGRWFRFVVGGFPRMKSTTGGENE